MVLFPRLVLILLLLFPVNLAAQESYSNSLEWNLISPDENENSADQPDISRYMFWSNIGFGIGTEGSFSGVISANFQFDRNLLTLRNSGTGELFGDSINDIALLYGRATANTWYHASLSAGIGYVSGQKGGGLLSSGENISPTFGLPLEAQVFFKPIGIVGVGVTAFANLNRESSFAGFAITFQLGKLR